MEPTDTYVKNYGDTYANNAYQLLNTSDGGFIMAGKTEDAASKKSIYVVKVAASGNEEWSKTYTNTNDEEAKSIIAGIDGGYVVASNQTDLLGNQTVFLTKIGATGSVSWRQSYFANDSTSVEKVIATSSDEYLMIGNSTKQESTNSNPSGKSDFVLIKVNSDGDFIDANQWGGVDDDFAYDIIENPGINSYVVVGSTNSFQPPPLDQTSVLIAEFGYPLSLKAKATHGGASDDIGNSIKLVSGGYVICGESQSNGNGAKDVYLVKLLESNLFGIVFESYLGGSGDDIGNSVTTTASGEYLIGGSTSSFGNGATDGFLIKADANGSEVFTQTYGSTGEESINDLISLSDNKIVLLGANNIGGNQMITLTKTKEDGTLN